MMSFFFGESKSELPTAPVQSDPDPFLLASWSASVGTTEAAAALQMAVVLAGAAGAQAVAGGAWGVRDLPAVTPVLVNRGAHRPKSLDALRTTVMDIDSKLLQRFAGFSSAGFREANELWDGDPSCRMGGSGMPGDRLERHRKALEVSEYSSGFDSYDRDFEPDVHERRLRTAFRPGMILENPDLASLSKLVAHCHDSVGLVPGLRLDALTAARKSDRDKFFSFLDGCDVELPESVKGDSIVGRERGMIRALLLANTADITAMTGRMADFADRVVLIDASTTARATPMDLDRASHFPHRHSRVTAELHNRRRKGHVARFRDWSREGHQRRACDELEFLAACDASDVPCAGLRQVPEFLRWALEQAEPKPSVSDDDFASIVRRYSFDLLEGHQRILRTLRDQDRRKAELALAEQVVAKIRAKQPLSVRSLVRSFDIQQVGRYRPVLALLLEEGVIVEDPDRLLRLGGCRFDVLKEKLNRSLAPTA